MEKYFATTTLIGFAAGLAMAAGCTAILWFNPGHGQNLRTAMDLLAGFPVVLARRWQFSTPICNLLFFGYWGLNGAELARLIRRCARSV